MGSGADTPEELEVLLEDSLIVDDGKMMTDLFEDDALLVTASGEVTRGRHSIGRLGTSPQQVSFCADPRTVLQAGDLALVLSAGAINLTRRGRDGRWRFVMCHLGGFVCHGGRP